MTGSSPSTARWPTPCATPSPNPGDVHWNAVKRIIRYLKGTADHALTLGGLSENSPLPSPLFVGYCDSDYANSPDHARSVSGYTMMIGSGCFAWSAKKQTATAGSTGEAEYYAGFHAGKEISWLRQLLTELGYEQTSPTPLRIDNTSAIRMIETPDEVSDRVKHIRVSYHWLREAAARRELVPEKVDTKVNIADIMTKALPGPRHTALKEMLDVSRLST